MSGTSGSGDALDVLALGIDSRGMDQAADIAKAKLEQLAGAAQRTEDAWEQLTRAANDAAEATNYYRRAAEGTQRAHAGTAAATREAARSAELEARALDVVRRAAIATGLSFDDLQKATAAVKGSMATAATATAGAAPAFSAATTAVTGTATAAKAASQPIQVAAAAMAGLGTSATNAAPAVRGAATAIAGAGTAAGAAVPVMQRAGAAVKLTSNEVRLLGYQISDVFQQLASGTNPFTILVQQGPQVVDALGGPQAAMGRILSLLTPMKVGIAAVAIAFGGMTIAAERSERALLTLQNRTAAYRTETQNFSVGAEAAARRVARSSGAGLTEATSAAATLGAAGVSVQEMERALRVAQDLSVALGTNLPDAAKRVADAFRNPTRAAQQLADEGFHTMDAAGVRAVRLLELAGDRAGATARVMQSLQGAVGGVDNNLTPLQQSLRNIANSFGRAWDAVKPLSDLIGGQLTRAMAGLVNLGAQIVDIFAALARGIGELIGQVRQLAGVVPDLPEIPDYLMVGPLAPLGAFRQLQRLGSQPPPAAQPAQPAQPDPEAERRQRQATLQRAAERASGNRGLRSEDMRAERQGYQRALGDPATTAEQARILRAALAELGREFAGLRDPMDQFHSQLSRQADLAGEAAGAARELAQAEQQADEIARQAGAARASDEDRMRARLLTQARLTLALDAHIHEIERQTEAMRQLGTTVETLRLDNGTTEVIVRAAASVSDLEISLRAQTEALQYAKEGTQTYEREVRRLIEAYTAQREAEADIQSFRNAEQGRRELEMLEAEVRLLTETAEVRERELAALRERQRIIAAGGNPNSDLSRASMDMAADVAAQRLRVERLRSAYQDIGRIGIQAFERIGEAITQSFATGERRAIKMSNILRGVGSELMQFFLRIAVLNPLANAVAGQNLPTLTTVLQVFGGAGGGTAAGAGGAAGGAGLLGGLGSLLNLGNGLSSIGSLLSGGGGSGTGLLGSIGNFFSGAASWLGLGGSAAAPATAASAAPLIGANGMLTGGQAQSLAAAGAGGAGWGATLGGIGIGIGGGMLVGGLIAGDSKARQTNSMLGSVGGALIGTALFGPIGGIVGGIGGGALGGLLGPGKGFSGGDALVQVNDKGLLEFDRYAGKNFPESGQLVAQAKQEIAQVNATLSGLGLTFKNWTKSLDWIAGVGGGESPNPKTLTEALSAKGGASLLQSDNATVQRVLSNLGDASIEKAVEAAQWVTQVYEPMSRARDAAGTWAARVKDTLKPFDDAITKAREYGLETDKIEGARGVAWERLYQDRNIGAGQEMNRLWQRVAEANGNGIGVLSIQQQQQQLGAQQQRLELEDYLIANGIDGEWAAELRRALEAALLAESKALARQIDDFWRQHRQAAEAIDLRHMRAGAVLSGNANDAQAVTMADFDMRAREEIISVTRSLEGLAFTAAQVTERIAKLTEAQQMERQALIDAFEARKKAVADSIDDRYFAATTDTSTLDGALAAFDRVAARERVAAAREGLADLAQLERAQAAERARIIESFAGQTRDRLLAISGNIGDYLNRLRTTEAGGFSISDRLSASRRTFDEDLAKARLGDEGALGRITSSADALLTNARGMYASGEGWQALRSYVMDTLRELQVSLTGQAGGSSALASMAVGASESAAVPADLASRTRAEVAPVAVRATAAPASDGVVTEIRRLSRHVQAQARELAALRTQVVKLTTETARGADAAEETATATQTLARETRRRPKVTA